MRLQKIIATVLLTVSVAATTGCGAKVTGPFVGDWAYVHDPTVSVLNLKSNGKATLDNHAYTYTADDSYIYLKNTEGEQKIRYEMDGDKLMYYQTTVYDYAGESEQKGIVGFWMNEEKNWSYEFTEDKFLEDGVFPGQYQVDEEAGTIKLMYNDHFVDTYIYYTLEGDTLTIEYPWPMVNKTKENTAIVDSGTTK